MDRKQLVVERTRAVFNERLDDVVDMVRQDRRDLRGYEEPVHVRAVLRRTLQEGGSFTDNPEVAVLDSDLGRRAAEPDRGQQRESIGQVLDAALNGLDKVRQQPNPELTPEERLGLECVLLLYGRPAVLIDADRLAAVPPFWNVLEDQREDIEVAQRGVGRIELFGHPEYDWAGTAFLVNETTLMTTRRTADYFVENRDRSWQFRPGVTAWMDYGSDSQRVSSAGYRVRNVIGIHEQYDLALLEVDPPPSNQNWTPTPLPLAAQPPAQLEGRPVYLIGYPVRDARRNEPQTLSRIFRDVYNCKRVQPGLLCGAFQFRELQLLRNDCTLLGHTGGACIVDLETHQVLGMQLSSRYLETGTAIPMWVLRNDPLLAKAGVRFAETNCADLQTTTQQLERLARSRHWPDVRNTIRSLYQRVFGPDGRERR
ncbi:MAG TPA: serine protease [Gemmataceae bacterium]|nr:serine protease [Gemmataceae bacterium]